MCALLPAPFCRIPLATDKFILHSRRRRDRQPFSIVDQPLAFSRSSFSASPASRLYASRFCCLSTNSSLLHVIPYFFLFYLDVLAPRRTDVLVRTQWLSIATHIVHLIPRRPPRVILIQANFYSLSLSLSLSFSSALSRLGFTFRFFLSMAFLLARGVQQHLPSLRLRLRVSREPPHRRARIRLTKFFLLVDSSPPPPHCVVALSP